MFPKSLLKITSTLLLLCIGSPYPARAEAADTKPICQTQLNSAVDAVTKRGEFTRMSWGISVKNLVSGQNIYNNENSQKYFIPASTAKLLTTAAALKELGSDFRIRTSIYQDDNSILRIVGRGDPSLTFIQLQELGQQLKQQGINVINQLVIDDTYFQGEHVHPSWQWEDIQADYGAPINSLILNQNTSLLTISPARVGQPLTVRWAEPINAYQWRLENNSVTTKTNHQSSLQVRRALTGAVLQVEGEMPFNSPPQTRAIAVMNPTENFLLHFRHTLQTAGIAVKQAISGTASNDKLELAALESPPLSELLVETNANSNNLYAEALLRAIAVNRLTHAKEQNTGDVGLEVVKNTLTPLGVDAKGYLLVDGSGLSRKNLITPTALVETLAAMRRSPQGDIFTASLAIAGVNGTLKNRFVNTPAVGVVRGKTGTMTGVVTLAGYVNTPNYPPLAFSILVNQSHQPARVVRQGMDEIVLLLTQLRNC